MRRQFVIFLLLIWACTVGSVLAQSSYNVPESGSQTVSTCDAWIYDNGGENGDYSNYNEGYLVIYPGSGGGLVSVTSGTYSIETSYDYVEIYSGVGTNGLLLETLTGQNGVLGHAVTSRDASGALTIRFHSDGSIVKSGFALQVQCINPAVMSSATLSGCSFYWTDPGGTGNYANNENVIQTICSDNGEFLTVDFTQFSLSNGDYLYVYDGNSISATLIGTYTGTTLPGLIVSSGSCLTFRFTSNNTGVSSGWTAIVLCSSCSSGGNPASTNPGSPCAFDNIHPFCTDQGQYVYNSGSTGSASDFFGTGSVGCLSSTPAPAWYYMRIEQPGDITIHITQQNTYGGGLDVDFACWGPFSATSTNNFVDNLCCGLYQPNIEYHGSNTYVSGYPFGNLVDCSFDAASTEDCHIHNAQTGQFYLLLITNYSQSPGVIYFNSTAGSTATTDCSIMAEVSNDGPYCVGDTIHLYCNNPQSGATYQWTGPNGWSSTQADPVIYPATAAMNGYTYSLVKTMNGTSSSPASTTLEVIEVNTSVTVNPSNATICRGSSATLTASNVNGYQNTYSWSPGGQSNRTITVAPNTTTTYTVTQTVNGCEGTASVTVTVHQPQHQSYTVNQCASSYRWSVNNQTYTHSGTFTYAHTDAYGCTQVDTLHLTLGNTQERHIYASVCLGTPYNQNGFNITSAETGVAGVIERTHSGTGANGCDSTTVLHLTVNDTVMRHIYASVCLGTPYNQDGFNITSVETGVPGVIERTNSATGANGCDSTVVLHLTVYPSMHTDTNVVAYDQFVWNGSVYEEGGVYTYAHFDVNGCEQVDTLHLTLYYSSHTHLFDTACLSYFWYGRTYSASGEYDYLLQDIHGADSLLTLHLSILDNDTTEFDKQVCFFYSWEGSTYYEEGDYTKTLTNSRGCDSIVTLHLSIQDTIYTDFDMEACNFFMWNNVKLTTSGLYDHVYNVAEGCDSMVTLNLTIYYDTTVVVYQTACESYTWNDSVYTQSGSYERHFSTVHGCDSAVTLVLTINHHTSSSLDSTICDTDFPFEWNGVLFTAQGVQHTTLVNAAGCDSLITMKLSVNPTTFAVLSDTIIENDLPYDTLGMHFTDAGVLSDTIVNVKGCDSIVTMHLTVLPNVQIDVDSTVCENQLPVRWNEVVFTQAGVQSTTMTASNRVDSVVVMHLIVNPNTYSEVYDTVIQNNLPHTFLGRTFSDSVSDARIVIPNAQGCDSVITYSLFVWRNVEATADTLVCEADLPLVWNGVVFVEEGDSSVTLTGAHGVDSLLMMRVRVSPSGYAELHEEVCMNDFPYRYVNGEIDTTIVSVSAPLSTFRFQLRTLAGCDSIVTLDLDVTDTVLNIVSTDDFCTNMHTTLTVVSDLTDYVWSTGETTASIEVYEPGYYWVTASQGDCEGRAFLRVDACKMEVRLPNAITPGKMDGLNDCFRLPEACLEHIETFEITVFNRWGEVVFHSKDKNFKWYGDYKGEVYREDVYSYTIKYIDTDGIMFRMKGAITVL